MNNWKKAILIVSLLTSSSWATERSAQKLWDDDVQRVSEEARHLRTQLRAREAELRAIKAFRSGDFSAASKHAQESLRLDPKAPEAYETLASAAAGMRGDVQQVIADYNTAIEARQKWMAEHSNPRDQELGKRLVAASVGNRGSAKFRSRDLAGALADFEEALRLGTPFRAVVTYGKADVLASLGRFREAREAYEAACAADASVKEMGNRKFENPRIKNFCQTLAANGQVSASCN